MADTVDHQYYRRRRASQLFTILLILVPTIQALPTNSTASPPSIDWNSCSLDKFPGLARLGLPPQDIPSLSNTSGLDCGNLTVPVNWNNPAEGSVTLGMTRLKATNPDRSLGSLLYNPGGPGGSTAVQIAAHALGLDVFSEAAREHYDIIGPDPRGVGMSTPVQCDPDIYNQRVTLFPTNEQEFQQLVTKNKALGESCKQKTGALFDHVDTTSAARDIEAIRKAIDPSSKVNYLGVSYETMLGAAYAELFPRNFGRMVLDSNVDHSQSETDTLHAESSTYEDVLNQFFLWCNTTVTQSECPFKGQNLPLIFDNLVSKANQSPINAPACVESCACRSSVTGEDLVFNVQGQSFLTFVNSIAGPHNSGWSSLATALQYAIDGNASALSTPLASSAVDPLFAGTAIGCLDWLHNSTTLADTMYKEQLGSVIAPHTKGACQSYTLQTSCIGWPAAVANPNHYLARDAMISAPPIVMANAYHDPEASYVWAEGLLGQVLMVIYK